MRNLIFLSTIGPQAYSYELLSSSVVLIALGKMAYWEQVQAMTDHHSQELPRGIVSYKI